LYVVVCPRKRHFTAGTSAARAGNAAETRAETKPRPRIRREIERMKKEYMWRVNKGLTHLKVNSQNLFLNSHRVLRESIQRQNDYAQGRSRKLAIKSRRQGKP
jgi:hypothetical protein